jgi:hypothetical protein
MVIVGAAESFSITVRTAVPGEPNAAPPVGLLRVRLTVSLASYIASSMIETLKLLLDVSPFAQLKAPLVAV